MLRQYFSLPRVLLKRKVFYAVLLLLVIGCISQIPRRPTTSRRSMTPEEPQNTTVTADSGLSTSSSVGAYTAADFAARPHLYSVAVEVKENQTLDELATMA
ncbi:unnamed protein product, partial [Mesorhabditis spiculigera]